MKAAIFIVGLLSALSALFFGWVFCISIGHALPLFVLLILIVPSLWLLPSSFYLLLGEHLPSSRKAGIILGLNILLVTSMVVVAKPIFFKARVRSSTNSCVNNLRQIDAAANQFAFEHGKTNGEVIRFPDDLTPYIKLNSVRKIPPCPAGGVYHIGKVGDTPTCSLGATVTPAHVLP